MVRSLSFALLLALGVAPSTVSAAPTQWAADPNHSSATFTIVHLAISKVTGVIPIKSATIVTGQKPDEPTSVEATLDPAAIDTRDQKRDDDLRSADFFEVAKYPAMTFKSTSIAPGTGGNFTMVGNLTMHGVTKPVTLNAHYNGSTTGARNEQRVSYSATGTIDRRDFGINWGQTTPGGSLIAGNSVALDIEIEAVGS